jgi:aromatic ring-cleaving dioxygenase
MSDEAPTREFNIRGWHAHIYFTPETRDRALKLRGRIADELRLLVGSVHDKPVGPHTEPMFQVIIPVEDVGRAVPWFSLNRDGLDVLLHPSTGNGWADHTRHALWMGKALPINRRAFE